MNELPAMHGPVRIKVCCIGSVDEARVAIAAGASAVGLVSAMPSGPGVIDETRIRAIADSLPPAIGSFLLTSRQDAAGLIEQQRRCRTNTLQLVDYVAPAALRELRDALPGVSIVQVIHVVGERSIEEALAAAPYAHGLLLDSGNPSATVKELGGTGRLHDWQISRRIRDAVRLPVFLAGGLSADNVGSGIRLVQPFGVDLCSSVRTNGELDEAKLGRFVAAVARADAGTGSLPS